MGLLRLAVLGTPEVFHDDRRLSFTLRKAQALLLYPTFRRKVDEKKEFG